MLRRHELKRCFGSGLSLSHTHTTMQISDIAALVSAVFTTVGAIAAIVYVELTRRLWQEAAKQREAGLMLMLMNDFDSLRDSVQSIRDWYMESASGGLDPVERFSDAMDADFGEERARAEGVDRDRFRVSRFFVRTRKLVRAGYLSEQIVSAALRGRAIEDVFLKMVDPLDAVSAHYGQADRNFYSELLMKNPRPKGRSGDAPSA